MLKKISLLLSVLMVSILVGCSSPIAEKAPVSEDVVEEKQINVDEYEKADFIKLNVTDEDYKALLGKQIVIEGDVDITDLEGKVFDKSPNIGVTQVEGSGFGMYKASGYELKDCGFDIKEGDAVRVYGMILNTKITGMPTVLVNKIEKL